MPPPNTPAPHNEPIQIVQIPQLPPSATDIPHLVSHYKGLRLSALQLNPSAFSSTYAHERQFPYETWVSRVQSTRGKTYIAITKPKSQSDVASTENNTEKEVRELLDSKWVGQVALLGPVVLTDEEKREPWMAFLGDGFVERDFGLAGTNGHQVEVVYMIMGLFVLPAWRAKRIGRRLIEAAVKGAREEKVGTEDKIKGSVATAMVEKDNHAARRLYEACGFDVKDGAVQFGRRGEVSEIVAMGIEID